MKNTIVLIIIIISGLFLKCSKEDDEAIKTARQKTADQQLIERIDHFLDDINKVRQMPEHKSKAGLCLDTALWYIEAALNYTSTNSLDAQSLKIQTFETDFNISENDDHIELNDVQKAYDYFKSFTDSLVNINSQLNIFVVDASLKKEENNVQTIAIKVGTTKPVILTKSTTVQTSFIHDWIWGMFLGTCNGSIGTGTRDATTELTSRLNQSIIMPPAGAFWCDIEEVSLDQSDGMFYDDWSGLDDYICLSTGEMEGYYETIEEKTDLYQPLGKDVIYRDVWWHKYTYGLVYRYHVCDIQYGKICYGFQP